MRFTYNQYNYYESGYRIPSKMHSSGNSMPAVAYQHQHQHQHHHHKSNFGMRMTMSTASTMTPRIHRKGFRTPSKRHPGKALPGKLHSISRIGPGKLVPGKRLPQRPHPPPCDNSNDSGFGFDQHLEVQSQQQQHHQQQQSQQQQQAACSSSGSSSGSSSTCTNLGNSHSHHGHNNHHHNIATTMQHNSPQQHLIRAISASRSTPAKRLPYDSAADDDDVAAAIAVGDGDDDEDFCTDDSNDYSMPRSSGASPSSASISSSSAEAAVEHLHHPFAQHGQRALKRKKIASHVELDNDDACSEDAFIRKIASASAVAMDGPVIAPIQAPLAAAAPTKLISAGTRTMTRVAHKRQPAVPMNTVATSSDGHVQLEILSQPEQQHRARYQTEGSRGAVKDRSGNGFPIVRLIGYGKPAVLQVFIGTDIGRVAPHMFYQACKVAGKNSTQCNEKKVDGTMVIEIDFKPETDMTVTCDCVGILKERNVDVEHRFPNHLTQKNKKKSTRCRMVFRTQITNDAGAVEALQVCSNPIVCTQPPGVPEICKKSLNSCPVDGGLELFIIGKNFLKDTHVIFQESYESAELDDPNSEIAAHQQMIGALWEQTVLPDKEYLQQTHLICTVPPYIHQNILKPVTVQVAIISSGKKSESHSFVYTPKGSYTTLAAATTLSTAPLHGSLSAAQDADAFMEASGALGTPGTGAALWPATEAKHEIDSGMMPPPISTQMPMGVRRPSLPTSTPMITDQQLAHLNAVAAAEALKTELLDESSQSSIADAMHSPEAASVCSPHSPTAMQYHSRYGRKASMEAMMYESNSLPGFPVTPAATAVAAVVEMAVQNEIVKEMIQQQQAAASVDKFITDLAVGDAAVAAEQSLFGVNNTASAIDHAFTDILQQAAAANAQSPVALERNLSISSNSSSHSSSSGVSSPLSAGNSPLNALNGHNSPITQDIILNSEPAATLNVMPMQQLLPSPSAVGGDITVAAVGGAVGTGTLSTDLIMNPSVSPSTILCSANGAATAVVPNIMSPHQVKMANSILNDIAMQAQPTQQDATVAALALSNIMMSPPPAAPGGNINDVAALPSATTAVQPDVTASTSTAVSNLIIKAAADFISNQEQQSQQQQALMAANVSGAVSVAGAAADSLANFFQHHDGTQNATAAAVSHVQAQASAAMNEVQAAFPLSIPANAQQESLIVALATENALQQSVSAAAVTTNGAVVTQQTSATTTGIHTATAVSSVPLPQELTTMSDQDLLSYINPSTFDQM